MAMQLDAEEEVLFVRVIYHCFSLHALRHCLANFHIVICFEIWFVLGAVQLNTSKHFVINGATGEYTYEFAGFKVWPCIIITRIIKV